VLLDQRTRWQQGEPMLVEVYLAQQPALNTDAEAVLDLIAHEVLLRQEQGELPQLDEYQRRFPDLAAQIQVQFEVERLLQDKSPETLSPAPGEARHALLKPARGPGEIGWLGPYRILKVLGTGGMGIVFQGEDPQLKRLVALKTLKPAVAVNAEHHQRFLREAQAAALLESDHIVPIYQVGEDDGVPFLAMPFLTGTCLERRLKDGPSLTISEVVRLGMQIARGLTVAHERGLVHRDIKPANIWLEKVSDGVVNGEWSEGAPGHHSPLTPHHSPRVKILDFGLARVAGDDSHLTQSGTILGTPAYMAPEQADGGEVDARADLFSLGTVLYEMATGKRPFQGDTYRDVLAAVVAHTPPPPRQLRPALPPALDRLIMRLLSKRPAQRPGSAQEVAETLRALQAEEEGRTPASRRWLVGAVVTAGFALVLALALWLLPQQWGGTGGPIEPAPLVGERMNVFVWSEEFAKRGVEVRQPGALPVRNKDLIQIEFRLNRPAHLYLLWIDSEGGLTPLYPWNQGNKLEVDDPATPPPVVDAAAHLLSPPAKGHGWKMAGPSGLETVVLLARRTPLPPDFPLVKKIGKQKRVELRNPQEVAVRAWERGRPVPRQALPPDLFRRLEREAAPIEEELMKMMKRLKDDFELIRLVQFAHEAH
jgi:serine/threonine protein kinase